MKVEHFKIWIRIGNPYIFGFGECKKLQVSLANLPFLDLVKEGECVLVVCEGSLWVCKAQFGWGEGRWHLDRHKALPFNFPPFLRRMTVVS